MSDLSISEETLLRGNQNFFSFAIRVPGNIHYSNWMTIVDGQLHDAYWVDDDTYADNEIPTSPLVSVPAIIDATDQPWAQAVHQLLLKAISDKVGYPVNVPMLCEAEDSGKICALKLAAGYRWDPDMTDYVKDTSLNAAASTSARTNSAYEPTKATFDDDSSGMSF